MRQKSEEAKIGVSICQLIFSKLYCVTSPSSWHFGKFMRQKWRIYVSDDTTLGVPPIPAFFFISYTYLS
jgi:hypothetical protein